MGNKPNLTVNIELIKALSDTQTEVMISVSEKGVTGSSRKIPASDLSAFLNQQVQKQQLSNVGVTCITAYMTPTKAQLEDYLKNPPPGMCLYCYNVILKHILGKVKYYSNEKKFKISYYFNNHQIMLCFCNEFHYMLLQYLNPFFLTTLFRSFIVMDIFPVRAQF